MMGVKSYISPKAKVAKSAIHGRGLFAVAPIKKGEIIAIKGGHILDKKALQRIESRIDVSYIQIEDNFYIGATKKSEVASNKLFLNHSCEPNVGIRGQITFIALRDIKPGAELTYDWAMEENGPERTQCACGAKSCRKILTATDWKRPELQKKYKGFFSVYLKGRIL